MSTNFYGLMEEGARPRLVAIEVSTFFQIPTFQITGLASTEIHEARERIRAAVLNSDLDFPKRRVVVNLAPASIPKSGTGLDLPIALAILRSSESSDAQVAAWGELSLDGRIRSPGRITRFLTAAKNQGIPRVLIPAEARLEAQAALSLFSHSAPGEIPDVLPVETLQEAFEIVRGKRAFQTLAPKPLERKSPETTEALPLPVHLERLFCAALAGGHSLFLIGPKGSGKSRALDWVYALAGDAEPALLLEQQLLREMIEPYPDALSAGPVVRRIGAQVKAPSLIGSATSHCLKPGEYALAHGGFLIADELPEWSRDSLESLREPLERHRATLTRKLGSTEWPARFTLIATGNACPCGGWPREFGEAEETPLRCLCTDSSRRNYLNRISGPVLDRVDFVLKLAYQHIAPREVCQDELRAKVTRARQTMKSRLGELTAFIEATEVERRIQSSRELKKRLDDLTTQGLSRRGRHRLYRMAMALAIWDEAPELKAHHLQEARLYHPLSWEIAEIR